MEKKFQLPHDSLGRLARKNDAMMEGEESRVQWKHFY
jgi:hypothetical protein